MRGRTVRSSAIRKELGLLQRALKYVKSSFTITLPKENNKQVVIPTDYELDGILGDCSNITAAAMELASITAMRRSEIIAIRPEHRVGNTLNIPHTKNGTPRTIPLPPRACNILDEYPRFPIAPHSLTQAFRRSADRLGYRHLHFHSLRHYACTQYFLKGLSVMEVSSITGHKDLRMLSKYTHIEALSLAEKLGY